MDTKNDPDNPDIGSPGRSRALGSIPPRPLPIFVQQLGQQLYYQPAPAYRPCSSPERYGLLAQGPFGPGPLAQYFPPQQNPADATLQQLRVYFQKPINPNRAYLDASLPVRPTYPSDGSSGAEAETQHRILIGPSQRFAKPSPPLQICGEYAGEGDVENLRDWNSTVKAHQAIGAPSGSPHVGWPANPDAPAGDLNTTSCSQGTTLPLTTWDGYAHTDGFSGGSLPPNSSYAQLDRLDDYRILKWPVLNQHSVMRMGVEGRQREPGEHSSESEPETDDSTTLVSSPFDTTVASPSNTTSSAPSSFSFRPPTTVSSMAPTESALYRSGSAAAQGSVPESSLATDKTYHYNAESKGRVHCRHPGCPHTTGTTGGMRRHMKTKHTPAGDRFPCPVAGCGQDFVGGRLDRVKNHLESAACKGLEATKVTACAKLDAIRRAQGTQAALNALKLGINLSS